jgi:HPt (histidine-containing phosphotransfer) domain-containing protein
VPSINSKVIEDLRALQAGGSPTFLAELIDIFLREMSQNLERLRKSLEGRDGPMLERVAHTLKGSCGNLGADSMSKMCAQLQSVARTANWPLAQDLVAEVVREGSKVEAELRVERSR